MPRFYLFLFLFLFGVQSVQAQDAGFEMLQKSMADMQKSMQQLQQTIAQQNELIQNQQIQINAIESKTASITIPAQKTPVMPVGRAQRQNVWNPEIGAIGDIVGQVDSPGREDAEGRDRISVRELELVLGSAVDSYSRLDATLAFSDFEEAGVEEAYYTHFGIPWGFTARFGKFKPHIGKALQVHRDSLDTVDEPLVIQRYFGVEGYNKAGVDLTKNIDLSWPVTHQVSFGLLEGGNGEDGTLFGESRRHPTLYANLKNYLDVTSEAGVEAGLSYLGGSSERKETFGTHVLGANLTGIWRYADQRHFKVQSETFSGLRAETRGEGIPDDETTEDVEPTMFPEVDDSRHFFGSYVLADWRFHPQWAVGTRFDYVNLIRSVDLIDADGADKGWAAYLTFYQSEFARWRIQLNQRNLTAGEDPEYEAFIQGTFAIGEHKHKIT